MMNDWGLNASRAIVKVFLFCALLFTFSQPLLAQGAPGSASPHGSMGASGAQSGSIPDSKLSSGTVLVEVLGAQGQPLAGIEVVLTEHFQSISQGNETRLEKKTSSADGKAKFSNLKNTMRFSYSVSVLRDGAKYSVQDFRLSKVGQHVILRTFPVTHDEKEAFVGMRGFIYVQLQADSLKIDALYRVMNMGQKTWMPENVKIQLPAGASAIDVGDRAASSGFKKSDESVTLFGSFPPGQRDVSFSFLIPNSDEATRILKFTIPPHVAELRVLAEAIPGMGLDVTPGFDSPQKAKGPGDGKDVLITRRLMEAGQNELSEIRVELSGLPVRGPSRWIALSVALLILLLGLAGALKKVPAKALSEEKTSARQVLLEEMFFLQQAFQNEEIGPRTFEEAKREILKALARLESQKA